MGKVSKEKVFNCTECDAAYATVQGLSRHRAAIHKENETLKCSHCGKEFGNNRKDNLRRHEGKCVLKQGANARPKKCNGCGTEFASNFSLNRHAQVCKKQPLKKRERQFVPSMLPASSIPDLPHRSFSTVEMMFLYAEIGLNEIKEQGETMAREGWEQREPADVTNSSSTLPSTPADVTDSSSTLTSTPADVSDSYFMLPSTPADVLNQSRKSAADQRKLHRAYTDTAKIIKESLQKLPPEYHCEYLEKSLNKAGASNLVPTSRNSKPRGIHRTADYVINMVWEYWKSQATVSNARTSRPATMPVTTFETDHVLMYQTNISSHIQHKGESPDMNTLTWSRMPQIWRYIRSLNHSIH